MTYGGTDASFLADELISFTDRGCKVQNQGFQVSSNLPYYAVSWHQQCDFASGEWNDRIGVFLGAYAADDPQKLRNLVTVACIPSYQNTSASVSVIPTSGKVISIEPADANKVQDMQQQEFRALHSNIDLTELMDNTFRSDSFGRIVYRYAQQPNGDVPIEAAHAVNATQALYRTFFAALAQR